LKNGKGLDKDHQSSPFKPALLTVVDIEKKTFSSEFFYGPSFFHEETKKKRENLHVMKKNIIYICPALSSQV